MSTVRIYDSEQQGLAAAREAEEAGFETVHFLAATAVAGREEEAVRFAAEAGCIAGGQIRSCAEALRGGRSIVAVSAPFGRGLLAGEILDRHGPSGELEVPSPRNPAPFSEALGIPVLADRSPMTDLSIFQFSFGEPKVSRNAAPFSSRLGLPLLTRNKSKRSSFGLPLLSKSAAPLSSMFRMPTLTRSKSKSSSFGMPLLSRNPTPISSLFGMRVLSKKNENDRR